MHWKIPSITLPSLIRIRSCLPRYVLRVSTDWEDIVQTTKLLESVRMRAKGRLETATEFASLFRDLSWGSMARSEVCWQSSPTERLQTGQWGNVRTPTVKATAWILSGAGISSLRCACNATKSLSCPCVACSPTTIVYSSRYLVSHLRLAVWERANLSADCRLQDSIISCANSGRASRYAHK